MTQIKKENGFTIIELMIAIALIGLLASAIIIAVSQARTKAANARIKNNMDQIRKQAEVVNVENNLQGYCVTGGKCAATDLKIVELLANIKNLNGGQDPVIISKTTFPLNYCVSSTLKDGKTFCMDSAAKQTGTVFGTGSSGTCTVAAACQ